MEIVIALIIGFAVGMVFASGFPADGAERSDSGVTLVDRTEILEPRQFSSAIFIDSRLRPRVAATLRL
jgi:hypothetical protein